MTDLDPGEQALWLLQRLEPELGVPNVAVALRLRAPLRWWPLQEAVTWLLARHEVLRLSFPGRGGVPERRRHDAADVALEVETLQAAPAGLAAELRAFAAAPFDLEHAPLMRLGHFVLPDGEAVLCMVAHHIVIDAVSLHLLFYDLKAAYDHLSRHGEPPDLPPPHTAERPAPTSVSLAFWQQHVAGFDAAGMRLDGAADAVPGFEAGMAERFLSSAAVRAVGALRDTCRATDAIVLLAAYYVLLYRHGTAEDMVVGAMVNTRRGPGSVGYHVSTLPLRLRLEPQMSLARVVARTKELMLAGLEHADVPFEMVAAQLAALDTGEPGWWRSRLVRYLFNFRHPPAPAGPAEPEDDGRPEGGDLVDVPTGLCRFDLELTAERLGGDLSVRLVHSREMYPAGLATDLLDRLDALLAAAAADPEAPIVHLDLRSARDLAVIREANATAVAWRGPATVLGKVYAAAAAAPDAVAVVEEGRTTTFAQLLWAAAEVRDQVRAAGDNAVVALAEPRGTGLAAAVLGVWAAGAAYLPLDAEYPAGRLAFQLDDVGCTLVIGGRQLPAEVLEGRRLLTVEVPTEPVPPGLPELAEPAPDDLAYLIYTSGSTGAPKGVRLTHRNLHNVVAHFAAALGVGHGQGTVWLTTFAFDISALELCLPLTTGGRVLAAPDAVRSDPHALLDRIERWDAQVIQATPTTWRLVAPIAADRLRARIALCGGEPLPAALAARLRAGECRLFNVYGPTETTIWSTAAELDGGPVTVGQPIANTQARVVDRYGRELPPGLTGELWLSGDGVADGYHRRPELTAERFAAGPPRSYRTGDIARWRRDGQLELLGRSDRQVKLRAHRVELGEVENVLESHPSVRAAAAVLAGDPSADGYLAAFVVADGAAEVPGLAGRLWDHAARMLPGYALPGRIVIVETLPQTANGKVDTAALAARIPPGQDGPPPAAPRPDAAAPTSTRLAALWAEVLHRDQLDEQANFFLHGGTSLQAVELAERATRLLAIPVTMGMVFRAPTPTALAAALSIAGPAR